MKVADAASANTQSVQPEEKENVAGTQPQPEQERKLCDTTF